MVDFDLDLAHPDYREPIASTLSGLLERYPQAALRRVWVAPQRREGDLSLGSYDPDAAAIRLNSYWFGKPMVVLQEAARTPPLFHGDGAMLEEPRRLLAHEFAHALEYGIGFAEVDPRARELWEAATHDPRLSPAQYGLSNPTEFLAELFAAVELGVATEQQREQLRRALGA